jgi:hypothetical protein
MLLVIYACTKSLSVPEVGRNCCASRQPASGSDCWFNEAGIDARLDKPLVLGHEFTALTSKVSAWQLILLSLAGL